MSPPAWVVASFAVCAAALVVSGGLAAMGHVTIAYYISLAVNAYVAGIATLGYSPPAPAVPPA